MAAGEKDELKICIQPQDEIQKNYEKAYTQNNEQISDVRTAFDSGCEWTDLTYEKMETVKTEYENGDCTLNARFDDRIIIDVVQVEFNGEH